jgi:hypothetical protein
MPDDRKLLFAVLWRDDKEEQHVDLATVDILSGKIERLGLDPLPVFSLDLDISPNGKWAVLADTSTLNDQVCLLINLEKRMLECLTLEKGQYLSSRFTDNESVVYVHRLKTSVGIYISRIDKDESKPLVLGLNRANLILSVKDKIILSGATYDNYKCSGVYVINRDGSDLRRLSYLGQECLTDEELMR